MVLRVKEAVRATGLELGVDVVAVPLDDVVLIFLREFVQRMHLVLNNLLTGACFEVLIPGCGDVVGFDVGPLKEAVVDRVRS